jgi:hypothetical protein
MMLAKSQVLGSEDQLLCIGTSIGWVETRLRDLEVKVAEQAAQIAALQCQAFLDEEADEREVASSLSDGANRVGEGLLDSTQALS